MSKNLLNQINSKYILKKILALAFKDMKSLVKFINYDKKLINTLDIHINDFFQYKTETETDIKIEGNSEGFIIGDINFGCFDFFIYLIYVISFFKKGKFNHKNLKKNYNENYKNVVDVMDNYVLIIYFVFIIIMIRANILLLIYECKIKWYIKIIFVFIYFLNDFFQYIIVIIKFVLTKKILEKDSRMDSWFYGFDIIIIVLSSVIVLGNTLFFVIEITLIKKQKNIILKEINRINIKKYNLPPDFDEINEKEKIN